jgi:hypothetical protein
MAKNGFVHLLCSILKKMRTFFLCIFLLAGCRVFSQALYGTALVPGSVNLTIDETIEVYCKNILESKKETHEQYSTSLTGVVFWDNGAVKMIKMFPHLNGMQGTMPATEKNHIRRLFLADGSFHLMCNEPYPESLKIG